MATGSRPAAVPGRLSRRRRAGRPLWIGWQIVLETWRACFRYRVTGLAGEAAFFAVLSLPPLIFALAGAIGYVAQRIDVQTIAGLRQEVLALASRALTPDAVSKVIAPTLDEVLSGGQFTVISIGFLIALWSGSRALNVFIDTITIMYGMGGRRSFARTRVLSFFLYLLFLVLGVVVLPVVLAGPTLLDQRLPGWLQVVGRLYWPIVLLGSICFLATLFHWSIPVRTRWRTDLPGAVVTLCLWIGGSALLRVVLGASTQTTSIYGPLAAPIAVLLWLYLTSMAVLVGAALNAALNVVWPRLVGVQRHPDEEDAAGNDDA